MGFFSKIIPERKWVDVVATLTRQLKDYRGTWFAEMWKHVSPMNIGLTKSKLTPAIESVIASLQWAVAATTVREGGYVRLEDCTFFTELLYIALTGRKADEIMNDLAMRLLQDNDLKNAMNNWANTLIPVVSDTYSNPELAKLLSQWSSVMIAQTKILTCEACYDRKGAEALRNTLR